MSVLHFHFPLASLALLLLAAIQPRSDGERFGETITS